jgi:hypothetical protein
MIFKIARFEVYTALDILVEVLWVVTPCSIVMGYHRFRDLWYRHLQGEVTNDGGDDIWCGYEVPGMILLSFLKGAMRLNHSKDMSVHVLTCNS